MSKCTNCNSEKWELIERIGSIETLRCTNCGKTEDVHLALPLGEIELQNFKPLFKVSGRWKMKPTIEDMAKFKSIIPMLKNLPNSAILRSVITNSPVEFGVYSESSIAAFAEKLAALDIEVIRTEIKRP